MTERDEPRARRIGAICVEKGLITQAELDAALAVQESSGQVLGEILVGQESMTRMQLADVLGEQWGDMTAVVGESPEGAERWELRVLLEEAQAARAHLAQLSEELGGRLGALETLVAGVSERLTALQAAQAVSETTGGAGSPPPTPARRRRNTATTTEANPKPKPKPKPKPARTRAATESTAKKRTSSA